jgi:hypothetical protein
MGILAIVGQRLIVTEKRGWRVQSSESVSVTNTGNAAGDRGRFYPAARLLAEKGRNCVS